MKDSVVIPWLRKLLVQFLYRATEITLRDLEARVRSSLLSNISQYTLFNSFFILIECLFLFFQYSIFLDLTIAIHSYIMIFIFCVMQYRFLRAIFVLSYQTLFIITLLLIVFSVNILYFSIIVPTSVFRLIAHVSLSESLVLQLIFCVCLLILITVLPWNILSIRTTKMRQYIQKTEYEILVQRCKTLESENNVLKSRLLNETTKNTIISKQVELLLLLQKSI